MNRLIQLLTLLLFGIPPLFAQVPDTLQAAKWQQAARELTEQGELQAALPLLRQAGSIYLQADRPEPYAQTLLQRSRLNYRLQDFPQMQVLLDSLLKVAHTPIQQANTLNLQGAYYYAINNYPKALEYYLLFEEKIKTIQKDKPEAGAALGPAYNNIATIYGELLHFEKAELYFNKAKRLYLQNQQYLQVATSNINISLLYPNEPKGLRYSWLAFHTLDSIASTPQRDALMAKTLNTMAVIFMEQQKFDSAATYLNKIKGLKTKAYLEESYLNMGRLNIFEKNWSLAESNLLKALDLYKEIYGQYHVKISACYEFLGTNALAQQDNEAAKDYFLKGMNALTLDFQVAQLANWPADKLVLDPTAMINLLLLYGQSVPAQNAYPAVKLAIQLSNQHSKGIQNLKNQNKQLGFYYGVYELGIKSALDLYLNKKDNKYLDHILQYMEQSRAQAVMQTLFPSPSFSNAAELLKSGRLIENQKDQLVYQIFEAHNFGDGDIAALQQQLEEKKKALQDWKSELKQKFPKLYELRYGKTQQILIKDIQENLTTEDQIIEYFHGEDAIYAIAIGKVQVRPLELGKSSDLQKQTQTLYPLLSQAPNKEEGIAHARYMEAAYPYFTNWLQPMLLAQTKRLVIVPDGDLAFIPFESLPIKNDFSQKNFKNTPFLLHHFLVHYQYASSLNLLEQGADSKGGILGFAPGYNLKEELDVAAEELVLRKALSDLPGARAELEKLFKLYRGSFYFNRDASEATFKESIAKTYYAAIHLAMHGMADSKIPALSKLVFSKTGEENEDDILHAYEILQLSFNSNLVVLSACETGYGQYERGEGILSLGRSFTVAGVPAIINTLWQLNNQTSAKIMELFYELLARGYNKDEALREAKRVFLNDIKGISAHPHFWASYISLGDESPLELNRRSFIEQYWLYGMLIVFGVLGLVIFFWRINQLDLGREDLQEGKK